MYNVEVLDIKRVDDGKRLDINCIGFPSINFESDSQPLEVLAENMGYIEDLISIEEIGFLTYEMTYFFNEDTEVHCMTFTLEPTEENGDLYYLELVRYLENNALSVEDEKEVYAHYGVYIDSLDDDALHRNFELIHPDSNIHNIIGYLYNDASSFERMITDFIGGRLKMFFVENDLQYILVIPKVHLLYKKP